MAEQDKAQMDRLQAERDAVKERRAKRRNLIGLVLLGIVFVWSVVHVSYQAFFIGRTATGEEKKRVIFAHWQLEGDCVRALDWAADEYMKLHPDVLVQQIEIPERAYKQWVRTQLIGRTAPDLIEAGRVTTNTLAQYFVPITDVIEQPNPYNKLTDEERAAIKKQIAEGIDVERNKEILAIENAPWRETYVDGMLGGFDGNLQEYYHVPLSLFTVRIFVNKTLIDKAAEALGKKPPASPKNLSEFMQICEDIKAYAKKTGQRIVPIAGSKYTENMFRGRYLAMASWGMLNAMDAGLDGGVSSNDAFQKYVSGEVDLSKSPNMHAAFRVLFDITRHFNPGFMAAERDQSVLLFAQQNAAMIATGTWDAGSLARQIGDKFEIAVFDFPPADPDDPKYGKYIRYRTSEAGARAGFPMSLCRYSKHRETAIDFAMFISSRKINEEINRRFKWFPAVRGADTVEILRDFRPKVEGIYTALRPSVGNDSTLRYDQRLQSFMSEDDPSQKEYQAFLAEAKKGPVALKAAYGRLAEVYLKDFQNRPDAYSYAEFIDDWRNEHVQEFLDGWYADITSLAFVDFARDIEGRYQSIFQGQRAIDTAQLKLIEANATGDPAGRARKNLIGVVYAQVKREIDYGEGVMLHREFTASQAGGQP